jgi:hypothetical protein
MNLRARPRELDRIRRDLAEAFRIERDAVSEATPEGFHALLRHLETRVHEVEREKAFSQVGAPLQMRAVAEPDWLRKRTIRLRAALRFAGMSLSFRRYDDRVDALSTGDSLLPRATAAVAHHAQPRCARGSRSVVSSEIRNVRPQPAGLRGLPCGRPGAVASSG